MFKINGFLQKYWLIFMAENWGHLPLAPQIPPPPGKGQVPATKAQPFVTQWLRGLPTDPYNEWPSVSPRSRRPMPSFHEKLWPGSWWAAQSVKRGCTLIPTAWSPKVGEEAGVLEAHGEEAVRGEALPPEGHREVHTQQLSQFPAARVGS